MVISLAPAQDTWHSRVEDLANYLSRKSREIREIQHPCEDPQPAAPPRSVDEVAARKFRAGAAAKSERAGSDWQLTETHWADATSFHVGPFEVGYSYQRADLNIDGPPLYETAAGHEIVGSIYTSCGMSAMASLLVALGQSLESILLIMRADGYPETRELVAKYGAKFGFMSSLSDNDTHRAAAHILLLDSGVPASFPTPSLDADSGHDLVVFDTTCLAASSGRIGAVLRATGRTGLPTVLVRSHTKLDSLGIEYGRLGSVVVMVPQRASPSRRGLAERLLKELHDAVRLFGTAAVPAHLPEFMGTAGWRRLYRDRVSHIMRNNRWAARRLSALIGCQCAVRCYQHGLFLTITPPAFWDEHQSRHVARLLAQSLRAAGLPVRPAGSFGFDFAVVDAFPTCEEGRFCLRMAVADLPHGTVEAIVAGTADWCESALSSLDALP